MLQLNFLPFPDLYTDRLHLRRIRKQDAQDLLILRTSPDVMRYIDRPPLSGIQEAEEMIDKIDSSLTNNEGINWGISLINDAALLGTIAFWKITKEHYRAEIGYMLHPEMQGKGIMNEAMGKILHYGFANMKLHSVEANVNPANDASIRLLKKNGFIKEAYFKENYFYDGKFLDSVIYSLLTPIK